MDLPDLRPLSFGELLDRTFTYYRRRFWLFLGIMVVPEAVITGLVLAFELSLFYGKRSASDFPNSGLDFLAVSLLVLGLLFLVFVCFSIPVGAATCAASEIHLGRPVTARASYRMLRGHIGTLLRVLATIFIRYILMLMVAEFGIFGPVWLVSLLVAQLGSLGLIGIVLGVALDFGAIVAFVVFINWFILRYSCAVPALLLENLKAKAALKRSIELTKANVRRAFTIVFVMMFVTMALLMVLFVPEWVGVFYFAIHHGSQLPEWITIGYMVVAGVAGAATAPLILIALTVFYYDLRVRKEGFDLQAMMATLDSQAALAGSPAAPAATPPANPSPAPGT